MLSRCMWNGVCVVYVLHAGTHINENFEQNFISYHVIIYYSFSLAFNGIIIILEIALVNKSVSQSKTLT